MKSTQLLSVVFSLIMFTGVTAGNTAFAESDEIDDILEDFCEMTLDEQSDIISKYELDDYAEKLAGICDMDDDVRDDALDEVIDAIELEVYGETEDDSDDTIEDFEDCVEAGYPIMESYPEQCMTDDGQVFTNTEDDDDRDEEYDGDFTDNSKRHNVEDRLAHFCDMSEDETAIFFEHHPRLAQFEDRLANYCDLSDYSRDSKLKDFIRQNITDEDREKVRDYVKDYDRDENHDVDGDFREKLASWCEMTDEEKSTTAAKYGKTEDQVAKADRYCTLDESDRADFIAEHRDEFRAHMKDKMHDKMTDKKHMDYDRLCDMTDSERAAEITDVAKLDRLSKWCEMSTEEREEYKMKHYGTDKPKMMEKKHHMDYDRLCGLAESERALEIDDSEKLDRISDWCEMSTEEREDYKMKHHDSMKDKKHDFDGMSDMAKDRMSNVAKDKLHENKMKMSDKSDRLKAMIMNKHDISDERADEIKMKYIEKHGDLTEQKKSDLKMKYKDHIKHMKYNLSDERKSEIHDRLAEMKAFKAELREKSSDMTEQEKQELREEFIEKAKDMQLAWINPRMQMTAGVDSAEVECREGFSLVMKASNGVAMCLKADTALKMIDRGIVVPAN